MADKPADAHNGDRDQVRDRHLEYLWAINNPSRREILRELEIKAATIDTLQSKTNLDIDTLKFHLGILEHALCIEKIDKDGTEIYSVTKEGKIVDRLDEI
jgi:DNA-binding transcriptional ArsR family regulator